ncbi:HlyD family secretion protein [hydrothermal vent metagenome]|uniref:HlyD family secretion protein n=1 Tax=hydrothermal vent metagenome TaxID=652676 RepID=A0A3B0UBV6_9ZZZZ
MKIHYLSTLLILILSGCNSGQKLSDAYGNFEADPVIVSAEAAGKVLMFQPEEGQELEAGAIVGIIDTILPTLKKKQAIAQIEAVKSKRKAVKAQVGVLEEQLKNLEVNEARVEKMLKDGAATQKQLDDITGNIRVVEKQVSSTRTQFTSINKEIEVLNAQMEILDEQLEKCKIINPVKGTVLETFIEQGEITPLGRALFKIAGLRELNLKVYVSGAMLPSVKIGQQVEVIVDKDGKNNQSLEGTVTWISPEAEFTPKIIQTKEERVKLVYAVKVKVKNDGRLKIGMPGEVRF